MSEKDNKKLVGQIIKAWNEVGGDVAKFRALFDKYYASGFVYHTPTFGDQNREQALQGFLEFVAAFPDLKFTLDDIVAEAIRW